MTRKTRQRIDRIKIEIRCERHSSHIIELMSEEFGLSPKRVANLLTVAYAEVEAERKRDEEIMEQERKNQIIAWVQKTMLTEQEAVTYISEIIRGMRKEEKVICTQKGAEVVKLVPRVGDVLKAFELYRATLPPVHWMFKDGKYVCNWRQMTSFPENPGKSRKIPGSPEKSRIRWVLECSKLSQKRCFGRGGGAAS